MVTDFVFGVFIIIVFYQQILAEPKQFKCEIL